MHGWDRTRGGRPELLLILRLVLGAGGTGEGYSRIWHLRANISITPLAAPMSPGLS
eukprot:COSAG01_NODE_5698_length_4090_cov_4.526936_3_plen_56_part_00